MIGSNSAQKQFGLKAARLALLVFLLAFAFALTGCSSDDAAGDGFVTYDDFTGTDGDAADATKWTESIGTGSTASILTNTLDLSSTAGNNARLLMHDDGDPGSVTGIRADMTATFYNEGTGGNIRVRIAGSFYNDENEPGGAADSFVSDIFAVIQLHNFDGTGTGIAEYFIVRCTAADCSTSDVIATESMGSVDLDESGTYQITFDSSTDTFTFTRDGVSATEDVSASASYKKGPNSPNMQVGIRGGGTTGDFMDATIDNFACKGCTVP